MPGCGIDGINARGKKVGNNFSQPGWAKVEVGSEDFEIIKLGTDMGIDAHTVVSIGMEDAGLKSAEQATTARDSQHHAAEFSQDLLPGFEGDAFSTPKVIKDGTQTLVAVRRQLQSLLNGIDEPAKTKHFRSAPAAVTFKEFLDGNRLLMEGRMRGVKGMNDFIDGMEQDTSSDTVPMRITLNQVAEVIKVDIGVTQGKGVRLATGDGSRGQGGWHAGHSGKRRTRHGG
jgi:hypothetical protein